MKYKACHYLCSYPQPKNVSKRSQLTRIEAEKTSIFFNKQWNQDKILLSNQPAVGRKINHFIWIEDLMMVYNHIMLYEYINNLIEIKDFNIEGSREMGKT